MNPSPSSCFCYEGPMMVDCKVNACIVVQMSFMIFNGVVGTVIGGNIYLTFARGGATKVGTLRNTGLVSILAYCIINVVRHIILIQFAGSSVTPPQYIQLAASLCTVISMLLVFYVFASFAFYYWQLWLKITSDDGAARIKVGRRLSVLVVAIWSAFMVNLKVLCVVLMGYFTIFSLIYNGVAALMVVPIVLYLAIFPLRIQKDIQRFPQTSENVRAHFRSVTAMSRSLGYLGVAYMLSLSLEMFGAIDSSFMDAMLAIHSVWRVIEFISFGVFVHVFWQIPGSGTNYSNSSRDPAVNRRHSSGITAGEESFQSSHDSVSENVLVSVTTVIV